MFEWRKGDYPNGLDAILGYTDNDGVVRDVETIEWELAGIAGTVDPENNKHLSIPVPNWDELVDGMTATVQATADARFGEGVKPIILTETIVFVITPEAVTGTLTLTPVA